MTPERILEIQELYHAVCEATPADREALLGQADPDLRREVDSLLSARPAGEILERLAIQSAPELLENWAATQRADGSYLGPYRIENRLAEGGMGEVFRAVDTRLDRPVAIKVSYQQFSARLEREARAIASLNHPNICTLYDVGPNYLVMELVEGDTLAARLKSGPLPMRTALVFASQIAAALAEAHAKDIVHRDLKPGNIMIGKSGVKVLDFGLARFAQDETVTANRMAIGTPGYMAPEQRLGKPADARTDVYAFGCVLYEMLTGARITSQRRRIPSRKLARIVGRCLEDDPARRWQSVSELQRELQAASATRAKRIAAAAVAAMLAASAGTYLLHRLPKLTVKDTIVLADFENKTGDHVFDGTLREGLGVQLQQSPFLTLVQDRQIQQVLRFMKRPAETPLTLEVAREVCERTGSAAVLEGSIASLGSQYVLWLRARSCRTGNALAEEQTQAARKEEVLTALSRIAVKIRARLGESLASVQEHSTPLEEATTPSLDALKAYSVGKRAQFARGVAAAVPHYQRAVAIDPQFALALADLGFMYSDMGETDLSAEYTRRAYFLRDRVSDRERLYILMLYDRQVTGNLQKEMQTLESWVQTYPRDYVAWGISGGWATFGTGQYERGIQASEESIRLNPDEPYPYASLVIHNLSMGRFPEAAAAFERAAERKLDTPTFLVHRYYLAYLKGDEAEMKRAIDLARGNREVEDSMSHHEAMVLAYSGKMRNAKNFWRRAIERAQQAGGRERAAIYEAAAAVCEAHFGNRAAAKQRAGRALEYGKGRDVEYAAAVALALSGDSSGSQEFADDLAKRFPEDTPVQFEYLPTLRALFALHRHAPLDAIERLQTALPYDFAMPGTAFFGKFGGLYPSYVRGQAYLEAGKGREAAVEFQKIIDHRGIVLADPIGALAHLQLGRALASSGDAAKALRAYQDFLTIWKDADPEIPVMKQATEEYAELRKQK